MFLRNKIRSNQNSSITVGQSGKLRGNPKMEAPNLLFCFSMLILFIAAGINVTQAQDSLGTLTGDEFVEPKTTLGGYGELHLNYTKVDGEKVDGEKAEAAQLDFHRFILFISHQFNSSWSLKSEIELEHNFIQSGQGALELEQAYLNYAYAPWLHAQVGVILASAGLINETHEPPLFLSVERPDYHKVIIPTTWFGNGAAISGLVKGLEYKATLMEGLNSAKIDSGSGLRSSRQEGFESKLENVLIGIRTDWVATPGLRTGVSWNRNQLLYNEGEQHFESIDLLEAHLQAEKFGTRLVLEAATILYSKLENQSDSLPESSNGFIAELGYNVLYNTAHPQKLIPWIRYSAWNTAASSGISRFEEENKNSKLELGIAILPSPAIVFKADMGFASKGKPSTDISTVNLGMGYMF